MVKNMKLLILSTGNVHTKCPIKQNKWVEIKLRNTMQEIMIKQNRRTTREVLLRESIYMSDLSER